MKILYATNWELPHTGGIWTYVCEMKQGLEQLGHRVDIFARQAGSKDFTLNQNVVSVHSPVHKVVSTYLEQYFDRKRLRAGVPIKKIEADRYCFEMAAALLDLSKYDILHAQDVVSARAISRVKPNHIPLVTTIHGSLSRENYTGNRPFSDYCIAQEYYGVVSANKTIVPSKWMKRILTDEHGIPSDKIVTIPYGIDLQSFVQRASRSTALDVPGNVTAILCPARLNPVKGHIVLMRALAKLKMKRTDWVCFIAGDGPLSNLLKQQARFLKLEHHVIFLGSRNDIPALLNNADIMVLPSLLDNQPFVIMEAQIAGKAIVTTDTGGIPEMVTHGETGLLSSAGDIDSLYQHLLNVLEDKYLRQTLAGNGKRFGLRKWSLKTALQSTVSVYQDVLT